MFLTPNVPVSYAVKNCFLPVCGYCDVTIVYRHILKIALYSGGEELIYLTLRHQNSVICIGIQNEEN